MSTEKNAKILYFYVCYAQVYVENTRKRIKIEQNYPELVPVILYILSTHLHISKYLHIKKIYMLQFIKS
jgi:hypothetical protein